MIVQVGPKERAELYARLPRVTDILARTGFVEARWFTQEARDLGSALHACVSEANPHRIITTHACDSD